MFTTVQFRLDFPEFADTARYPDSMLNFWGNFATKMVIPDAWQDLTLTGIELYVAHQVTLQARDVLTATNGGLPGGQGGPANTKTVGSTSVGYDSNATSYAGAGFWNLTTYGKQFYQLMRVFGAGCVQL